MAARNHKLLKHTYRLFAGGIDCPTATTVSADEFDESDVWGSLADGDSSKKHQQQQQPIPSSKISRKTGRKNGGGGNRTAAVATSLPVNVPDWSKILREEDGGRRGGCESGDEGLEDELGGVVIPPHELLWRRRGEVASFSVQEGIGRTLKGRDLSRVRNAIWEKTGFQD